MPISRLGVEEDLWKAGSFGSEAKKLEFARVKSVNVCCFIAADSLNFQAKGDVSFTGVSQLPS